MGKRKTKIIQTILKTTSTQHTTSTIQEMIINQFEPMTQQQASDTKIFSSRASAKDSTVLESLVEKAMKNPINLSEPDKQFKSILSSITQMMTGPHPRHACVSFETSGDSDQGAADLSANFNLQLRNLMQQHHDCPR